jgi:hypothetical protein
VLENVSTKTGVFLTFEAGDIVVYEHFDNAGDSNGQEGSVYIYAKIIRIVLNGTERFPKIFRYHFITENNLYNMSYVMRVHCHPFNC